MVGITSYGAYVPMLRLPLAAIGGGAVKPGGAVKAGSAKRVLVVAGETRLAAPRSALEPNLGDGAAALLVGAEDVAVAIAASHTVADEIIDVWRSEADPFVHAWEDRFIVDHGYRANVREVVRGLLAKTGLGPKDFAKLVLYGPDAR